MGQLLELNLTTGNLHRLAPCVIHLHRLAWQGYVTNYVTYFPKEVKASVL